MVGPQASGPGAKGEPVGIFVSRVFKGGAADLVGTGAEDGVGREIPWRTAAGCTAHSSLVSRCPRLPSKFPPKSGDVYEGDQICTLNGKSVLFASFHEALQILKTMQRPILNMTLRANPPVWALYRQRMVALQASVVESLKTSARADVSAAGGAGGSSGAPHFARLPQCPTADRCRASAQVVCVRAYYSYDPALDNSLTAKERRRQQQMLTYGPFSLSETLSFCFL